MFAACSGLKSGMSPVLLQGKRRERFGTRSHTQMAANRMTSVDSYVFFYFIVICTTSCPPNCINEPCSPFETSQGTASVFGLDVKKAPYMYL